MLPQVLLAIVPLLVSQAEKLFGTDEGDKKHQWVVDAVMELDPFFARILPDWAKAGKSDVEKMIGVAIVFALDKIEA